MALEIRPYREEDLARMIKVWNEVEEAGEAFPQVEPLTMETARAFFAEQTLTTVASQLRLATRPVRARLVAIAPASPSRRSHRRRAARVVARNGRNHSLNRTFWATMRAKCPVLLQKRRFAAKRGIFEDAGGRGCARKSGALQFCLVIACQTADYAVS